MNLSEQIAHAHLKWYEHSRNGDETQADYWAEQVTILSDRVQLTARQRNEAVQEMGVS